MFIPSTSCGKQPQCYIFTKHSISSTMAQEIKILNLTQKRIKTNIKIIQLTNSLLQAHSTHIAKNPCRNTTNFYGRLNKFTMTEKFNFKVIKSDIETLSWFEGGCQTVSPLLFLSNIFRHICIHISKHFHNILAIFSTKSVQNIRLVVGGKT